MIQQVGPTAANSLEHRNFRDDEFWREIPAWNNVSRKDFGSFRWQAKTSIKKLSEVKDVLQHRISDQLMADIQAGLDLAPMNIRITPYVFSLIDWDNPVDDSAAQAIFCRSRHKCCPTIRIIWRIHCMRMSIRPSQC